MAENREKGFVKNPNDCKGFVIADHQYKDMHKNKIMDTLIEYQSMTEPTEKYSFYLSNVLPHFPTNRPTEGARYVLMNQTEVNQFFSDPRFRDVLSSLVKFADEGDVTAQILVNKIHECIVDLEVIDWGNIDDMSPEARKNFDWYENLIFSRFRDNPETQKYMSKVGEESGLNVSSRFAKFLSGTLTTLTREPEALEKELEKQS